MIPHLNPETPCVISGNPCEPCRFYDEQNVAMCGNLAVGHAFVGLYKELAYTDEANRSLSARLDQEALRRERACEDILIPGCLSPGGMRDVLENNPEIQEAIKRGNKAVVYLDLRGQKFVNDVLGRSSGDLYIQNSHDAMAQAIEQISGEVQLTGEDALTQAIAQIIRQPFNADDAAPAVERRRSQYPRLDKLCRIGGDEFALLLSDISPEDLARFAEALQGQFSVKKALENYHSDPPVLPLIASVGVSHLQTNEHAKQAAENKDYWTMYRLMCEQADEQHGQMKKIQYQQMWDASLAPLNQMQRRLMPMPEDTRQIHRLFMETRCPDFKENPGRYMIPRLRAS